MAHSHNRTIIPFLGLALNVLLLAPALAAQADAPADVVGEVTAVIGLGKVVNPQGELTVARGQLIRAGDKIETAAGGHVHVRFVDGGLVSVRPLSRLHIEDYRNQGAQNLAAIRFKLDVGVMRSVTGEWGEAHRDRFRLNTPVAAIGIKGTDFVVKAENASTLVSVKTGAIQMSPLEGACAASLGVCAGERSVLLSADMQGQMLEYLKQNDKSGPRLVPHVDLLAGNNRATTNNNTASESARGQRRPDDDQAPVAVAMKELDNRAISVVAANEQTATLNTPGVGAPATTPALPPEKSLVWLHNVLDWNVPAHTISTRFDEASAAGRQAAVGNFFITLYRDETTRKGFSPPATSAEFALLNVSANYVQPVFTGRPVEPVSVSGARLSADFARSTLATQLDLASPSLGKDRFTATATITPTGLFSTTSATQQLGGAFSNGAAQAGYQFEKQLPGGTVSGLTLWGR